MVGEMPLILTLELGLCTVASSFPKRNKQEAELSFLKGVQRIPPMPRYPPPISCRERAWSLE